MKIAIDLHGDTRPEFLVVETLGEPEKVRLQLRSEIDGKNILCSVVMNSADMTRIVEALRFMGDAATESCKM